MDKCQFPASNITAKVEPDPDQVLGILAEIKKGKKRNIRVDEIADGIYEAADPRDVNWLDAYRQSGLQEVPVRLFARKRLARAVDAIRNAPNGLSSRELARQAGVSHNTIFRAQQQLA